jgi:hypothetical protein
MQNMNQFGAQGIKSCFSRSITYAWKDIRDLEEYNENAVKEVIVIFAVFV